MCSKYYQLSLLVSTSTFFRACLSCQSLQQIHRSQNCRENSVHLKTTCLKIFKPQNLIVINFKYFVKSKQFCLLIPSFIVMCIVFFSKNSLLVLVISYCHTLGGWGNFRRNTPPLLHLISFVLNNVERKENSCSFWQPLITLGFFTLWCKYLSHGINTAATCQVMWREGFGSTWVKKLTFPPLLFIVMASNNIWVSSPNWNMYPDLTVLPCWVVKGSFLH